MPEKFVPGKYEEVVEGFNPDGSHVSIRHKTTLPDTTVLPPPKTPYMGKDWMAIKLGHQKPDGTIVPAKIPDGTQIFSGNHQLVYKDGQQTQVLLGK